MRRQQGFTILEVLVGFLVAALLLGVILSAFAGGLRNLVQTDRYSQAALVAQSRLAELGVVAPLQEGIYEGRDDSGYGWQVSVSPLAWEFYAQLQERERVLYKVDVRVYWQNAGRLSNYHLSSLRLGQ